MRKCNKTFKVVAVLSALAYRDSFSAINQGVLHIAEKLQPFARHEDTVLGEEHGTLGIDQHSAASIDDPETVIGMVPVRTRVVEAGLLAYWVEQQVFTVGLSFPAQDSHAHGRRRDSGPGEIVDQAIQVDQAETPEKQHDSQKTTQQAENDQQRLAPGRVFRRPGWPGRVRRCVE